MTLSNQPAIDGMAVVQDWEGYKAGSGAQGTTSAGLLRALYLEPVVVDNGGWEVK